MEIINEMETGRRVVSTKPYAPVTSAKNFNPRSANRRRAFKQYYLFLRNGSYFGRCGAENCRSANFMD